MCVFLVLICGRACVLARWQASVAEVYDASERDLSPLRLILGASNETLSSYRPLQLQVPHAPPCIGSKTCLWRGRAKRNTQLASSACIAHRVPAWAVQASDFQGVVPSAVTSCC